MSSSSSRREGVPDDALGDTRVPEPRWSSPKSKYYRSEERGLEVRSAQSKEGKSEGQGQQVIQAAHPDYTSRYEPTSSHDKYYVRYIRAQDEQMNALRKQIEELQKAGRKRLGRSVLLRTVFGLVNGVISTIALVLAVTNLYGSSSRAQLWFLMAIVVVAIVSIFTTVFVGAARAKRPVNLSGKMIAYYSAALRNSRLNPERYALADRGS
jgi:hypothetical protein